MTHYISAFPVSLLFVAGAAASVHAQPARTADTVRLEVGSPLVNGRVYDEHVARVLVHRPDRPGRGSEWTNTLTFGDSAGRPVQRWVSAGVQRPPSGDSTIWELFQNYDRETLAPYGYFFRSSRGAEVRLSIDGRRVRGTRRASANAPVQQVDDTLPAPAFMANASDLVPLAVGLREGVVMTAPMWNPSTNEFRVSAFVVLPKRNVDVEGKTVLAWPVEERDTAGSKLLATWYLIEDKPYMVAGEIPLPGGGVQRMTEVLVPRR